MIFLNENYKPSLHKNILICITHIQFFNIYFYLVICLCWVLVVAHGIFVGAWKIFSVFGMWGHLWSQEPLRILGMVKEVVTSSSAAQGRALWDRDEVLY